MADKRLVHFDWTKESMEKGKAPNCAGRLLETDRLTSVTCPECFSHLVEIVRRWEDYGPGRRAGPR